MTKVGDKEKINEEKIHGTIDPFIALCQLLDKGRPSKHEATDKLALIIEGVFRRNIRRIGAIHHLIDRTDEFAGAAQEIMRNMLEDVISFDFIVSSDDEETIEKLTERFFDFQWVQLKDDLAFYRAIGAPLDEGYLKKRVDEIETMAPKIIEKYSKDKDEHPFVINGESNHSWLGRRRFEQLFKSIRKTRGLDMMEFIARAYIEGSRRTHFNPQAILELLELDGDKHHEVDWHYTAYETFVIAGLCLCWLTRSYLDNIPPSLIWEEFEEKLPKIEETLWHYMENMMDLHTHS